MNIPNQITVTRIFLIFAFIGFASVGKINATLDSDATAYWCHVAAYIIGFVAGCTDFVDGWFARKYNLVTDFGALMDPLADKIFVAATYIMMSCAGFVPPAVTIIIICREFMVTGLRSLAAKKGTVISADNLGKIKTILQMSIIGLSGMMWLGLFKGIGWFTLTFEILLWIVAILTVWSGLSYFITHRKLYLEGGV